MRRLLSILLAGAMLVAMTGLAQAAIGWAGQIWPVNGATVTDNNNVGVYLQIYKDGVTNGAGQGAGISATLYYGPNGGPYTSVAMGYNTDIGNNDEYTADIPSSALQSVFEIWFYCEAYDSTDASTYTGAQDQNGNDPPFKLNVTQTLGRDVMVYFFMCMPPEDDPEYDPEAGGVCITGDHTEITNWGSGIPMMQPCTAFSPRFYQVGVLFLAGDNPSVQYKYRKHDCDVWEPGGNHSVFIDDTNSTFYVPWVDHWGYYTGPDCPLCGIGVTPSTWGEIKQIYR
jgi:hypothetical protein